MPVTPLTPAATGRRPAGLPGHLRALEFVSAYLPLLLMALLALGTWWLVKNTPPSDLDRVPAPPRHEADYTMNKFMVQRFAPDGTMRAQIEGEVLRHYPDTDTLEIDAPRIRSIARDGRVTLASARRALSNGDASEIQLFDGAKVVREAAPGKEPIEFRSDFLHAFLLTERVVSHLPVIVVWGASELRADGMEYDNLSQVVVLKGRNRAVMMPPGSGKPAP